MVRAAHANVTTIRKGRPEDHEALLDLWKRSVTATHTFLAEADIAALVPVVRDQALPALELWVLVDADNVLAGFLGLSGQSIEALFIAPDRLRRGHGRRLLGLARRLRPDSLSADVNEQNPGALKFYQACGFEVAGRSPVDSAGRPFPLLHLKEIARR
jgi:putative acetyltransferase